MLLLEAELLLLVLLLEQELLLLVLVLHPEPKAPFCGAGVAGPGCGTGWARKAAVAAAETGPSRRSA